jgi:hypothetical protein
MTSESHIPMGVYAKKQTLKSKRSPQIKSWGLDLRAPARVEYVIASLEHHLLYKSLTIYGIGEPSIMLGHVTWVRCDLVCIVARKLVSWYIAVSFIR